MDCFSSVSIVGIVRSYQFSRTLKNGDDALTFYLAIPGRRGNMTKARVNVYGSPVALCRDRLTEGSEVFVTGELMNRRCTKTQAKVLEIKGQTVRILCPGDKNDEDRAEARRP